MSDATEQTGPNEIEASRSELAASAAHYARSLELFYARHRSPAIVSWTFSEDAAARSRTYFVDVGRLTPPLSAEATAAAPPAEESLSAEAAVAEVEQVISTMFADFETRLAAVHRNLDRVLGESR